MSARDPLKRLQSRIKQGKSYLSPPLRDVGSVNARRGRVKRLLCQRGRICTGTPPCPCWEEKGCPEAMMSGLPDV